MSNCNSAFKILFFNTQESHKQLPRESLFLLVSLSTLYPPSPFPKCPSDLLSPLMCVWFLALSLGSLCWALSLGSVLAPFVFLKSFPLVYGSSSDLCSELRAPDQQLPPVFLTSPLGEQRHPTSAFPMTFTLLRAKLFVGHTWNGKHLRVTFDSFLLHHRALSYLGGPSSTHVPPLPLLCQGQRQAAITSHHNQAGVSWWPLPSYLLPI